MIPTGMLRAEKEENPFRVGTSIFGELMKRGYDNIIYDLKNSRHFVIFL